MNDATTILVDNWGEALKQLNVYLALGVTSAVSAAALGRPAKGEEPVTVLGGFVPMAPQAAQQLLITVCFVAGALAVYAAAGAGESARLLQSQGEILRALCTFPSVATAALWARVLAALAPPAFAALAVLGLRETPRWGRALLFVGMLVPYVPLAVILWQLPCSL
jgi:hypothetical protein